MNNNLFTLGAEMNHFIYSYPRSRILDFFTSAKKFFLQSFVLIFFSLSKFHREFHSFRPIFHRSDPRTITRTIVFTDRVLSLIYSLLDNFNCRIFRFVSISALGLFSRIIGRKVSKRNCSSCNFLSFPNLED